ncbi:hypothetical protein EGT74_17920 [Chitinophaga lutea]|uniref:Universal stress protein n=1 Tax=Chitinophaga lutea TaxID=2488634 RepID=A0A3N4PL13_9BACT|nr:hypothetical protein [Chitinophaga lutea]RPE08896.1 hypothetical protein EGT74_17920 [Chitinophaga lutea]
MKKIIAAVDAFSFTEEELKSYRYIANKARGELTILFLENIFSDVALMAGVGTDRHAADVSYDILFREEMETRRRTADVNKKRLMDFYRDMGMAVQVRELAGDPATECLIESRLADLLVVRNTTSMGWLHGSNPPRFVKDMLADAECPVMVIPEKMPYIREVLFTYNGTASSSYAIRQFCLIFDDLADIPATVIYIAEDGDQKMPRGRLVKEYLKHHFEEVSCMSLVDTPFAGIHSIAVEKQHAVITFGAYGRSRASRFFHRSDADGVLRTLNLPIFITHP